MWRVQIPTRKRVRELFCLITYKVLVDLRLGCERLRKQNMVDYLPVERLSRSQRKQQEVKNRYHLFQIWYRVAAAYRQQT